MLIHINYDDSRVHGGTCRMHTYPGGGIRALNVRGGRNAPQATYIEGQWMRRKKALAT